MESCIVSLFSLIHNMKIFHWQTRSFAKHTASDYFNENIGELMDKFVETYLGYNRMINFSPPTTISLQNVNETTILNLLERAVSELSSKSFPSDVENIKDEILSVMHQTRFKMSLE
jgi:hypothetical protein